MSFNSISVINYVLKKPFIHSIIQPYILLFISLTLIAGCSNKEKIDEDKMILIYTDLLVAQDTSAVNDQNIDSLRTLIFERYNVSADEYEGTIEYYNNEPGKWEEFFDKVTAHIENLKKESG